MVTTRNSHLESSAATIYQLADLIESLGMTPRELGEYLQQSCARDGSITTEAHNDLLQLCDTDISARRFAHGLRTQADRLREERDRQVAQNNA